MGVTNVLQTRAKFLKKQIFSKKVCDFSHTLRCMKLIILHLRFFPHCFPRLRGAFSDKRRPLR